MGRTLLLLGLIGVLSGCSASASGVVDGVPVSVMSGYLRPSPTSGSAFVVASLTGESDGCANLGSLQDLYDTSPTTDEIVDWIGQNRPSSYWWWDVGVVLDDVEADLAGTVIDGRSLDEVMTGDQSATALAFHYKRHPTVEDLEGFSTDQDYVSAFGIDGGELTITEFTPNVSLSGTFMGPVEKYDDGMAGVFGSGTRSEAGSVSLRFDVVICEALLPPG